MDSREAVDIIMECIARLENNQCNHVNAISCHVLQVYECITGV